MDTDGIIPPTLIKFKWHTWYLIGQSDAYINILIYIIIHSVLKIGWRESGNESDNELTWCIVLTYKMADQQILTIEILPIFVFKKLPRLISESTQNTANLDLKLGSRLIVNPSYNRGNTVVISWLLVFYGLFCYINFNRVWTLAMFLAFQGFCQTILIEQRDDENLNY